MRTLERPTPQALTGFCDPASRPRATARWQAQRKRVLVLDVVFIAGILALIALVALVAKGVERL
jgi:hypothetical protein